MSAVTVDTFGYELARIAANACAGQPPHESLVGAVRSLLAADAAIVLRRDPQSGRLKMLAMHGYDEKAIYLMTSNRLLARDPALRSIANDQSRPPIRWWRDPDYVYETSESATGYLRPAGFQGGLSLRCFTESGAHVGDVHASTRVTLEPSPAQLDALGLSLPVLRSLVGQAAPRPEGELARVESGRVTFRSEEMPHADLKRVCDLLPDAPRSGGPRAWSFRHLGSEGNWYRVDLRGDDGIPMVRVHREGLPYGISAKELAVLDCLCDGLTNAETAARLFLSERTVAHHVERILDKLDLPSRTAAVALAIHEGLRLSPPNPPR